MQALHGRGIAHHAAQKIILQEIGRVFLEPQLGPLLRNQEFPVRGWKLKGRFGEEENLPALEHLAIRPRVRVSIIARRPARGQFVIFHDCPGRIRHSRSVMPSPLEIAKNG
jgi:hypothetical protein